MSRFERFFIIATLCLSAGVSLVSSDEGDAPVAQGFDPITFFIQWTTFGLVFYFCYRHRRAVMENLRYLRGPLPLVLLVMASTLWSVDSWITGKRSGVLLLQTLLGYYLGSTLNPDELSALYTQALQFMVSLSLAVVVLLPSYGISHGVHTGDWRGAFYHKNEAGEIMALALTTFGLVPPQQLRSLRRWGLAALSLLLLYKSNASSSIIAMAIIVAVQPIWFFLSLKRKAIIGVALAFYPFVIAAVLLVRTNLAPLLKVVGKDPSFTGRDQVWRGALDGIMQRPWLGYGFLAFFSPKGGMLVLIAEKSTFVPSHAHNGYLNLMLHVGVIGFLLFIFFLGDLVRVTVLDWRRSGESTSRWFLSFLTLIIVANLSESHFVESEFFWVSLVAFHTSFSVKRHWDTVEADELPSLARYEVGTVAS